MVTTLVCAVVGVGSVISVNIDMRETVHGLKRKIKEEKPNAIYFDADLLKLYLAKEGDTWLKTRDEAIKALKAKGFPDRIKDLMQEHLELDEGCRLNDGECFGDDFTPGNREVHVLVECPDEADQVMKYQRKCAIQPLRHSWF
jgi:hypothetical protein